MANLQLKKHATDDGYMTPFGWLYLPNEVLDNPLQWRNISEHTSDMEFDIGEMLRLQPMYA